jgi:hypothetical protein
MIWQNKAKSLNVSVWLDPRLFKMLVSSKVGRNRRVAACVLSILQTDR